MMQLLQNMGTEQQLLVFIILIAVVFFVVWLALRKTKLWYWKVNQRTAALAVQNDTLASIEQQLRSIGENLAGKVLQDMPLTAEDANGDEAVSLIADAGDFCIDATSKAEAEMVKPRNKFTTLDQGQSKNGHTYTVEQIESQIRE